MTRDNGTGPPAHLRCNRCRGQGFQYPVPAWFELIGEPMPPKLRAMWEKIQTRSVGEQLRVCRRCDGCGLEKTKTAIHKVRIRL